MDNIKNLLSEAFKLFSNHAHFYAYFLNSLDIDETRESDEMFDIGMSEIGLPVLLCNHKMLSDALDAYNINRIENAARSCCNHLTETYSDLRFMSQRKLANASMNFADPDDREFGNYLRNKELPLQKCSRWYYTHFNDVDYKDPTIANDMSLREYNASLAEAIETMTANGDNWDEILGLDIANHVAWDLAQSIVYVKYELFQSYVKSSINNAAKAAGSCPGSLSMFLDIALKPGVINWRKHLRSFVGNALSDESRSCRLKESRRFSDGVGHRHKRAGSLVVYVDTSGSMNKQDFEDLFAEINSLYKADWDIDIVECDAELQNRYKYAGTLPKTVFGGGGTCFEPVINDWNSVCKEYSAGIFFTDGYGSVANLKPYGEFLWLITSTGYQEQVYPGGKTLMIPSKN